MYKYNLVLRLNGSKDNEVLMEDVSPAEVMILRKVHGLEGIFNLTETYKKGHTFPKERERLIEKYVPKYNVTGDKGINFYTMFGEEHIPLPARLIEFAKKEQEEKEAANPDLKPYNKHPKEVDTDEKIDEDDIAG